ncbi:MAG TPA: DUF5990 family protein [Abditibacteriaceae bacterium]
MKNTRELSIHIICRDLPGARFEKFDAVRLGVQKGREVINDVPADTSEAEFEITLRVEPNAATGEPNFLGPFAFGTPQQRFLYLCWGQRQGDEWDGFRRAKIQLGHLTWRTIEHALTNRKPIEVSVTATDDRGGPVCGTLHEPFVLWEVTA